MAAREATLTNLDRAEYGVMTVDLDLLDQQIAWLAGLPVCGEREGILNLLGGIMDLTDPPDEEDTDQCTGCGETFPRENLTRSPAPDPKGYGDGLSDELFCADCRGDR
jgi:hypothetical protein